MSRFDEVMQVGDRTIGPGSPPFVVAELSANHLGELERALAIIDAAADAGADALKMQTYTADTITLDSERPEFQITSGPWAGQSLHALYEDAHTPWDWHAALFARARERGLIVFSAPFDATAVDLLEELEAPLYKIASCELVDHALIKRVAATGKPLILSTGMASPDEIDEAVDAAYAAGARSLAVLHCISGYPTPAREFNLKRMAVLRDQTGAVVGISDHTPGIAVAVAAVALGASVVEKHLTLRRADGGPDASFSLEPEELAAVVDGCRVAYESLGSGAAARAASEGENTRYRRSLYVVADVAAGALFSEENVRSVRPANGLPPKHLDEIVGKRAARDVPGGTPLDWSLLEDEA